MTFSKAKHTVGIVGLGIMGGAFAKNLAQSGWNVVGFDVAKARCDELAKAGVTIAASAGDVAKLADVVMTSLPSIKALDAVAAALAAAKDKRVVLEMGTFPLADK